MRWEELSENKQLDLLALYATGKLPVNTQQELARAALDSPTLFASLCDLTPLKQRLTGQQRTWVVNLWRRLRQIIFPEMSEPAFAAVAAGLVMVCVFGAWLLARNQLPDSPVVDLRAGAENPSVALADYRNVQFKIVDPQVKVGNMTAGTDSTSTSECKVFVDDKLVRENVLSVKGFVNVSIPSRTLQRAAKKRITVTCGGETKEYQVGPYFK